MRALAASLGARTGARRVARRLLGTGGPGARNAAWRGMSNAARGLATDRGNLTEAMYNWRVAAVEQLRVKKLVCRTTVLSHQVTSSDRFWVLQFLMPFRRRVSTHFMCTGE